MEAELAIRDEIKAIGATRCVNCVNNYLSKFYSKTINLNDTDFCIYNLY